MKALVAIFLSFLLIPQAAFAAPNNSNSLRPEDNPTREFIMSCTYGVLAGTLVGAASLAFTRLPSENLGTVARGASLGLYVGILLGLYVVYVVPGMDDTPDEEPVAKLDRIPFLVSPTLGRGFIPDGLQADWTVLRF